MTSDKNRGITAIAYNVIGQPERITFADGKTTEYVYSYDGTKLQVTHKSQLPPTETTTTYCDNLVYENGVLNDQDLFDSLGLARCAVNPETMQWNKHRIVKTDKPKKVIIMADIGR